MRGVLLSALLLLSACSGSTSPLSRAWQSGLDVGEAALQSGNPGIALQSAEAVLARTPGDANALLLKGDALTALGRFDDAVDAYNGALKSDPGSVRGRIGLGRIRLASDPAAAEALFLEAENREPRNTTALTDLGIARDLQGRHADAQTAYRQALGINPDLRAAQVNLALSMAMTGDGPDAVRLIRPLAEAPDASRKLRHDYAAVLAMTGQRAEAERILSTDLSPAETRQAVDALSGHPTAVSLSGAGAGIPASGPDQAVGIEVQLASAVSEDAANAEWVRLQEKLPQAMNRHLPLINRVERDGKVFWRLRTAGFSTPADARAFCSQVRAVGGACVVGGV